MKRGREEDTSLNARKYLRHLIEFPHDILVTIFHFLPARELFDSCALVSQDWYHSFSDQSMWKDRYLKKEYALNDTVIAIDQSTLTDVVNWKNCFKNSARDMWLMETYLHRLKKRVDALASTPGVTVTHFNLSDGITEDSAFEEMEKLQSGEDSDITKIPDTLRAFYRQTNGFALRWTVDPDAKPYESITEPKLDIKLISLDEHDEDEDEEDVDKDNTSYVINIQSLQKCCKPLQSSYFYDILGNDIDLGTLYPFSVPLKDHVDFLIDQNQDSVYTFWWIKRHRQDNDWYEGLDWTEFTNGIKYTTEIASALLYLEELLVGIDYFIALRDTTHTSKYTDVESLVLANPSIEWKDFEDEREIADSNSQDRDLLNIANHRRLISISFCICFNYDGVEKVVSLYPKRWNKQGGLVLEGKITKKLTHKSYTVIISAGRYKLTNYWQNITETKMENDPASDLNLELSNGAISVCTSAEDITVTLNENYDSSALINKIAGLGVWYRFTEENMFKRVGIIQ